MTTPEQDPDAAEAEAVDDTARERMLDGLPPRTDAEAHAMIQYEHLMAQVRALDPREPAPGWEDRVDARLRRCAAVEEARRAARRRRRRRRGW